VALPLALTLDDAVELAAPSPLLVAVTVYDDLDLVLLALETPG
jgi:hypothetical protein